MIACSIHTPFQTQRLATCLASVLETGDVMLLRGPIGAGKTTLVGELASVLGSSEPARSPTYTVAHRYDLGDARALAHLDLYRQRGVLDEAAWGDIEPVFESEYVCIEWPDAAEPWLEPERPRWQLELELLEGGPRIAWIHAPDTARTRSLACALTSGPLIP